MATAPTSPLTYTALPSTDLTVGPNVVYASTLNGTVFAVPGSAGFAFTTTAITPNVSELDWELIEADSASGMGPFLFASIDTDKALVLRGSVLQIAEGA